MPYPAGITLDHDFTGGALPSGWTFARASTATDSFYTDAAGSSYNSYSNNVPRFAGSAGFISETQARTQLLTNPTAPTNQTTPSLTTTSTGAYCLWVIGTGSATITANTGAATGLGTATAGNPVIFTVTTAGTFNIAFAGSITRAQLEKGGSPTSFIPSGTRAAETCTLAVGAWYSPATGGGTLLGQGSWNTTTGISNQGIIQLDDGTATNRFWASQNIVGGYGQVVAANVNSMVLGSIGSAVVANQPFRSALRWASNGDMRVSASGTLSNPQLARTLPSVAMTQLNMFLGVASSLGATSFIQRVQYWPFPLNDADFANATLTPPVAAVSASGGGAPTSAKAALSAMPIRPGARGRSGTSAFAGMRTLIPPTFAVVFARGRGGYNSVSGTPSFVSNVVSSGRGSARAKSAKSGALSSVAAAGRGSAQADSPRARSTFPQFVGAWGKATSKSRAAGAGTFSFSARGKASAAKGRITKFSPRAFGYVGRSKGRIRPTVTAGVRGRAAAFLTGDPIVVPPKVLSFWQKLSVLTPQHQLQEKTRVIANQFGDGYQQTVADGLTPIDRTLTLTWNPLERGDADDMLLFFRAYAGIPITFVAPRDTGPRHWLAISWQRTSPQPHADGVTVQFAERLYVDRWLPLQII
jgi:phage-related protein